jgi:hypothetical protein
MQLQDTKPSQLHNHDSKQDLNPPDQNVQCPNDSSCTTIRVSKTYRHGIKETRRLKLELYRVDFRQKKRFSYQSNEESGKTTFYQAPI